LAPGYLDLGRDILHGSHALPGHRCAALTRSIADAMVLATVRKMYLY
jgi:hypothetical protein